MSRRRRSCRLGLALMAGLAGALPAQTARTQPAASPDGPAPSVDTSVPFAPGATEILRDSPNAFFPSRYQIGTVGRWTYRLFPDGSAFVVPGGANSAPDFVVECPTAAGCTITGSDGNRRAVAPDTAPPVSPGQTDGDALARALAHWILTKRHAAPPPIQTPPAPPADDQISLPRRFPTDAPDRSEPVREALADPSRVPSVSRPPLTPGPPEQPAPDAATARPDDTVAPAGAPDGTGPAEAAAADNAVPDPAADAFRQEEVEWTPEPTAPVNPVRTPRKANVTPAGADPAPTAQVAPAANPAPEKPQSLAERFRLSCSVSAIFGMRFSDHRDGSEEFGKPRASLGCGIRVTERLSLRLSVLGYGLQHQKAPWDPNFTYALAYRITDWLTLSYSSYSAQFSDPGGNVLTAFSSGSFQLSARLPDLPLGERNIACSTFISMPQDYDHRYGLSCGIRATDRLTLRATVYAYAKNRQDPWDPDYVYTAAYTLTDDLTFEYSNYANNRWPWNPSDSLEPGPLGGAIRLSYRLPF